MIQVHDVDLEALGVTLPHDRLGVVISQPFQHLTTTEPFVWTEEAKPLQLRVIADSVAIAKACLHGREKTHFLLFPEYSLPGLEGVAALETLLSDPTWPAATLVIAGTDGLSKGQFQQLLAGPNTRSTTQLTAIADDQWVNCAITWVKSADGQIHRWLQPKVSTAWDEQDTQHHRMYKGDGVFLFRGVRTNETRYRFCSVLCFDWIAPVGDKPAWEWILDHLGQSVKPESARLDWFFVLENNPKPSHATFLVEVVKFFDKTKYPNVLRETAAIVFANSAGKEVPGVTGHHGGSSLILSAEAPYGVQTCQPTYSSGGRRYRDGAVLGPLKDVFFREAGACVHSFAQVCPASVPATAAGRMFPLDNAFVCPLPPTTQDARAPTAPVYASVKWLNDKLDQLEPISHQYESALLSANAKAAHEATCKGIRAKDAKRAESAVQLALAAEKAVDADNWGEDHSEALNHLMCSLAILGSAFPDLNVSPESAHAVLKHPSGAVDVIAIRGKTHEECLTHYRRVVAPSRRRAILVSRDPDNNEWSRRYGSFLDVEASPLGERSITAPERNLAHIGYKQVLDAFRFAGTIEEMQGAINVCLE